MDGPRCAADTARTVMLSRRRLTPTAAVLVAGLLAIEIGSVCICAGATDPPAFYELARRSAAVVVAEQTSLDVLDEGRLLVHRLTVHRLLQGAPLGKSLRVVEIRGALSARPLIADGKRAAVALARAPSYSYLQTHLSQGPYFVAVGDRNGVAALRRDAEADEIGRILALSPDAGARRLAMQHLACANARLVSDGIAALARLDPRHFVFDDAQIEVLALALMRDRVPASERSRLIEVLRSHATTGILPFAHALSAREPQLLAPLLRLRAELGRPAPRAELRRYRDDPDLVVRAAGTRAWAYLGDADALDEVARVAADASAPEPLRMAAIEGLGDVGGQAARRRLTKLFDTLTPNLYGATARAVLRSGNADAADNALADVAIHGAARDARAYAALLLLTRRSREHPAVRRVAESANTPEVRRILADGLVVRKAHRH